MFRIVNTIRIVANSHQIRQTTRKLSNLSEWRLNNPSRLVQNLTKQEKCITGIGTQNNGLKLWCALKEKQFHTSPIRNVHPVLLLLVKPVGKIIAIVFGKTVKRWWVKLPPERRQAIRIGARRHRRKFLIAFGLIPTGFLLYYVVHLEVDPITGRKRFIIINEEQMLDLARLELERHIEDHKANFLPPSHPAFKRVANVCNRLLKSNSDLEQIQSRKWLVTVVNEPLMKNAFVLPTGHIFMFTGLLSECMNDDVLCIILAHEISHVILNHAAEQISNVGLLDMMLVIPFVFIWLVLPDLAALLMHWVSEYFSKMMFHLPFSRALELEADTVGLQLAAKACYDVREASAFWARMAMSEVEPVQWLSTHPNSESRYRYLDTLMPQAIQLREESECPKLPAIDPRSFIPQNPYHRYRHTTNIRSL